MMDNEVYRVLSHTETISEVATIQTRHGGTVRTELKLPDGRQADVVWLDPVGDIFIFEVKTEYKASLASNAYNKYYKWCNYLLLAVPGMLAPSAPLLASTAGWLPSSAAVGIMGVYPWSTAIFHPPRFHRLIAEHRFEMLRLLV